MIHLITSKPQLTMKKLALIGCLSALAVGASAQGLVKFSNGTTTLVSYPGPLFRTTDPGPGFYYGLFTAPLGTTDPLAFTFAGIYATNTLATTGGRFQGGPNTGVAVAGWAGGESRSFEVIGWSASLGSTWNNVWLVNPPTAPFGISAIGQGMAGGTDSLGNPLPALVLFGAAPAITSGFILGIPEPASTTFAALGLFLLLVRQARKR